MCRTHVVELKKAYTICEMTVPETLFMCTCMSTPTFARVGSTYTLRPHRTKSSKDSCQKPASY